jgi:lysophospholipase
LKYLSLLAIVFLLSCGQESETTLSQAEPASLAEKLRTKVTPFINSRAQFRYLTTEDQRQVRYAFFSKEDNEATVVILPGYTEYIEKYAETIFDFASKNYNVLILDHSGMGRSSKKVKNPQVVHIDSFDTYVKDADAVISESGASSTPMFLLGHSTGALIGAHLVARDSSRFEKVAYVSPLFEMDFGDRNAFFSKLYLTALSVFRGQKYAPGFSDCEPDDYPFESNDVTSSQVRWQFNRAMIEKDKSLWMCGPSTRWVLEVVRASKKQDMQSIAIKHGSPVMLFMAKNDDRIVEERVHDFANWAPVATLRIFQDARHEIYREKEAHRDILMNDLFSFFSL